MTLTRAIPDPRAAWRDTVVVVAGGVTGVVVGVGVLGLGLLTVVLSVTVVFAVGSGLGLLGCVHGGAALQRGRIAALHGVRIDRPTPPAGDTWGRRLLAEARSESTWRQLLYHLLALVAGGAGAVLLVFAWAGGVLLVLTPLYDRDRPVATVAATVAGVALLVGAPWLARGLAAADLWAGRALLGPNSAVELARQVAALSRSRADAVRAADDERRRIERDLHDGMQQRLVTLAMDLGLARATLQEDDALRETIVRAHDDAKQALTELRDVVRGLHPAVLDDRGLDAALSGIAARSPVPVRVRAELPERPPAAIEAVAYFVVAEALTNVAKHANATRVEVDVRLIKGPQSLQSNTRLRVEVSDDGRGGVRPGGGTGVRGLAQRVSSVGGTLDITSPEGGPTRIVVELPCE